MFDACCSNLWHWTRCFSLINGGEEAQRLINAVMVADGIGYTHKKNIPPIALFLVKVQISRKNNTYI